jgi:hypothetical protein
VTRSARRDSDKAYGPDCVLSANFVTPRPLMTSTTCMTSP